MDALQLTRKLALFLAVALLFAGPASAATLTVNPTTTVTFSPIAQIVDLSVGSSDGTPMTFTIGGHSPWYSTTVLNQSGTFTTPATVRVQIVASNCSILGTCTDSFTIGDVTINVNNSGGSGGGSTILSANPNPLQITASNGFSNQTNVSINTTSTASVGFSVSISQGASWLSVTPTTGNVSNSSSATLTVTANSSGLTGNTTYYGNISVTPASGTALSIPVTFIVGTGSASSGTISVSPSAVGLAYPSGVSQQVLVSSSNSTTFTATANSLNGWLVISQGSAQGTQLTGLSTNNYLTLSVSAIAASQLSTNTYAGTVTVTNPADFTSATINVTLSVNGSTVSGSAAPASLSFIHQKGKSGPVSQFILVPGSGAYSVDVSGTPAFIYTSGGFTGPGMVQVVPVIGLDVGEYTQYVLLTSSGGLVQSIPVTLKVYSDAVVRSDPSDIVCSEQTNQGGCGNARTMRISASDGSAKTFTIASSASWVTVEGNGTTTPSEFTVRINTAGLTNGLNNATITVTPSGAANSQLVIPVAAYVTSGSSSGALTLSASSLNFTSAGSQNLNVTATSATSFAASVASGCSWLTISPTGSLTTNQNITVTVSGAGLTAGASYSCNLSFATSSGTQTVPVSFTVPAGGSTGNITTDKTSLTFSAQVGGAASSQTISVTSVNNSTGITFTTAKDPAETGWLTVTPASGTTPGTVTVSVNPAGLGVGPHTAYVAIRGNNTVPVLVNLDITPATTVSASPASFNVSYVAGNANPAPQKIQVAGTGQNLQFSAQVTSGNNWLSVSPAAGTAPAEIEARINPTELIPGSYSGTIVVAGVSGATGSTTITISLTVTAPLPTIQSITNAASFNTGSIAAGEIISLTGVGLGPAVGVGVPAGTTQYPTTLGGVTVRIGGYAAPLTYVSKDQINAIVPYEINRPFLAAPTVFVSYLGQTSNGPSVPQVGAAPGIFTTSNGNGQGAILNSNGTVNSAGNPANKGEVVVLYVTGEGQVSPAAVTGRVTPATPPYPQPVSGLVTVTIDGQPATVQFYGAAPALVAGVMQINVVVPPAVGTGSLPVVVRVGNVSSQVNANGVGTVTVAVK